MATPKVGPWPTSVINDFSGSRDARVQPCIWQPAATADLPTTTDAAVNAPAVQGDLIYDTTAGSLKTFTGSAWESSDAAALQALLLSTSTGEGAALVGIEDAGAFTAVDTVEDALQEIYQHLLSTQGFIPIPLGTIMLEDGTALTKYATGGATPGLQQLSNKEVVLTWDGNATFTPVHFSTVTPLDLDDSANVTIHWSAKMAGATDTPVILHECYFGAGDNDCAGTDDEIDGGTTLTEYTSTIAAADVPAAPSHLTVIFQPTNGEAGTDETYIYSVWLEYTKKLLTA